MNEREPGRYEPTHGIYCDNCRGHLAVFWCIEGIGNQSWSSPYCEYCAPLHKHAGDGPCAIHAQLTV